jgi:Flp pilus assembly protein CpaB
VILGLLLLVGALGAGVFFWTSLDETEGVLVLAHDVPPGATLQADDVAIVRMKLPPELAGTAIRANDQERVVGRVASEPLHVGSLLNLAGLQGLPEVPVGGGVMAIPVKPESAVGGQLQVGDRVRIVATGPQGAESAKTETVLAETVVYDVGRAAPVGLGSSPGTAQATTPIAYISVVVRSPEEMERLAFARERSALDVVWLPPTGRTLATPAPAPTSAPEPTPTSAEGR